ncbi:MAG: hypothetical protein CENE_02834 [Candidatus Celerinatantimonas neptuna]|nr:MAG: hypothetical protein CENE_02834 [Candidatus Celerinatantimonas neptuna]
MTGDYQCHMLEELSKGVNNGKYIERIVDDDYHVIAVKGHEHVIRELTSEIGNVFDIKDVEIHKIYSNKQINLYVRDAAKWEFDTYTATKDISECLELKAKTRLLFHSHQMNKAIIQIKKFIDVNISFADPTIPIISNGRSETISTGDEVKNAILDIIINPMYSQKTIHTIQQQNCDCVIELGCGCKSLELMRDNRLTTSYFCLKGIYNLNKTVSLVNVLSSIKNSEFPDGIMENLYSFVNIYKSSPNIYKSCISPLLNALSESPLIS